MEAGKTIREGDGGLKDKGERRGEEGERKRGEKWGGREEEVKMRGEAISPLASSPFIIHY